MEKYYIVRYGDEILYQNSNYKSVAAAYDTIFRHFRNLENTSWYWDTTNYRTGLLENACCEENGKHLTLEQIESAK